MDKHDKIGKKVDKFIMGALIGGAIGSVLGMTLAPKKGKETRELLKEKGKKWLSKKQGKKLFSLIKDKIEKLKEDREVARMIDEEETQKIPVEE